MTVLHAVPDRWSLNLTAEQLSAIEYLSKNEADNFRAWFHKERKCWFCCKPIDPDEPHDGHEDGCLYLACCDLAQMTDSE